MDEPGKDVENFGNKMAGMACRTSRIGSATIDLSTLVETAFIDCEVLTFHMKATCLHELVDSNTKALSADSIIRNLKTKLWSLKYQGLCSTFEGDKLDTEGDLSGIKMSINKLVQSKKRVQTGGNGQSQEFKSWYLSVINCLLIQRKGKFQYPPPLTKKTGASSINKETSVTGSETSTVWSYKRPENGDT